MTNLATEETANAVALPTKMPEAERKEIMEKTAILRINIQNLEVKDADSSTQATALAKECVALEKLIDERRDAIVRPMNEMVKDVNAKAKELVAPITEAKEAVRKKQVAYAEALRIEAEKKEAAVLAVLREIRNAPDEAELEVLAMTNENPDPRIVTAIEQKRSEFEEAARQRKLKQAEEEEAKRLAELAKTAAPEDVEAQKAESDAKLKQLEADAELQRIEEDSKKREAEEKAAEELKKQEKDAKASAPSGLRYVVRFEIENAAEVPRELCVPDDAKIREALKQGVREIPGVRIWKEAKVQ